MRTFPIPAVVMSVIAVLILACTPTLTARESIQVQVDPLVRPYVDNGIVVGMTVGVLHQGESKVFGYGRLSEKNREKPTGDTIFEIGSLTKVFTSILLADAVIQGHARLDQSAAELMPERVKMPTHDERAITLQDLATHVSGLPRLPANLKRTNPNDPYDDYSVEDLYSFLNSHKVSRAPGEKSEYSNLGAGLLGHLLERKQGKTYEQLIQSRIARPLNMKSTTITLPQEHESRLAPPHTADGELASSWNLAALMGAGGIRSSTNDLLRFARAQLTPPHDKLGEAMELAWKVHQKPIEKGAFAMGLGWHIAHDGSTRWHNGQTGGYHSMLLVNRGLKMGVVLLTNTATGEVDLLAQDIMRRLAGEKVEPREFKKSIDVSSDVMQKYVGKYKLTPELVFTVSVVGKKLMVGLTGQPTFRVFARSETEWFYKVVKASLTFEIDNDGKCTSVELFQGGVKQNARRIE